MDELRSVAEDAITAKDEVAELTGPESGVTRLLEEVTSARAGLERAEKRATTLGESVSRLEVLEQRADKIGKVQESLEGTVASSSKEADRTISELTKKVNELRSVAEDAITAKDEVAELTGPESGVTRLLEEVTSARAGLERAEKRATALGESVSRLEVLGQRADKIGKVQESLEGTVASSSKNADRTIRELTTKVDELRSVAEDAITAKDEVAELTGPESGVTRLLEQVTSARADLERAEKRATVLGESVSRLEVLGQRADKIGKVQESLEGAVASSSKNADRTIRELTKKVDELRSVAEDAITAKDEVAELTGPESGVTRLLEEVTSARADLLGPKGSFTKIRADMDELMADVGRLEGRADTFGQVEERIVRVSEQAGELEEGQKLVARFFESVSEQVVQTEKEAGRTIRELTTKVDELRTVAEDAITAKDEVAELTGPESGVTRLLEEVTSARADLVRAEKRATTLGESVSRLEVLEQRADKIGKVQESLEGTVERSASAAVRVEERIGEIQAHLLAVSTTEKLITDLMGPKGSFTKIRTDMDELMADVGRLEGRADTLGQVEERIVGVSEQAHGLEQDQKSMARSFESVSKRLVETDARVSELDDVVQSAGLVKQELEDFIGPDGAIAKVREQVEEAHEQSLTYGEEVARIREDQAGVRAAQESVSLEYRELRSNLESLDEGVDKANANVARVEKAKLDLTKAEELGARTERQLNALQALSDHILQKTGSVERQREALDRTEAQARALTDLHWELEAKLKEARSQIKDLKKVHSSVDDLRDMNAKVAERTGELRAEQAEVVRESKTLRAGLAGLQEQMRRTTKRFELEQSTLEADGQRVIALRADVTDLENRLHELEESGPSVSEASRKVDEMSARLTSLSGELGRIGEQVELVEGMREGMSEAQRMAVDVAASLLNLEARQSDVQDSMNDLQTLRGTGEEVAGALESLRATRSEIERLEMEQSETGAWLAGIHESMQELRTKVAQLDDLTANIDHMRENADRVMAAASDLDERRESFDELDVRMSELRQIGTHLDERTKNLLSGLVDADNRFKAVARNADKADDARVMVEGIMGEVEEAERRMAELGKGVDSTAERSEDLTLLSKRADRVMTDIQRGEKALSKAVKQLESLSALRKEAAEAVPIPGGSDPSIEGGSRHRRGAVRQDWAAGRPAGGQGRQPPLCRKADHTVRGEARTARRGGAGAPTVD